MCGRFALHAHPQVIALQFGLAAAREHAPRYNIAPTSSVLAVRADGELRAATLLRWGLVPHWAKDPSIGARLNHARAETVAQKPSFRDAYRGRRCLLPVSGFYEWKPEHGRKQPYYLHPAKGELLALAAIWERWHGPDGVLESCAIVTTEANETMLPIDDRMPVLIAPHDYARWLDCSAANDTADLLRPAPQGVLAVRRVSRDVNYARNESARLIEPQEA